MNASPVINLQTNFGGGKTHSMLALYHIFSATPATQYPRSVQDIASGTDLQRLGSGSTGLVISGQDLPPEQGTDHDGTHVNTLWGEIAWQLGGRAAYDRLARSDETGTNPGREVLDGLIAEYSPCVILIDEWVAHARQLYGDVEPARRDIRRAVHLRQALHGCGERGTRRDARGDDPVVGHRGGRHLWAGGASRLQNITRRVGKPWKAATARESFEIVRRRLFEEVDAAGQADIEAVARRFSAFYREQPGEFPAELCVLGLRGRHPCRVPDSPGAVPAALRRLVDVGAVPADPRRAGAHEQRDPGALGGQRRQPDDHAVHGAAG